MKADTPPHITLIGCGNMGGALLQCWLKNNLKTTFTIIKPTPLSKALTDQSPSPEGLNYIKSIEEAAQSIRSSDLIILAIKPQIMTEICQKLKPHLSKNTPILSIAAGKTIQTLSDLLHPDQPVIRAMPNTPVAIGKGVTGCIANTKTTPETKLWITDLFATTGIVEWITNELLLNSIAALSGSGPAYLFYIIESLEKAGIKAGLPADLTKSLAKQTIIGASALAEQSNETPKALRENVTSPGGTTEAALKIMMDGRMQDIFNEVLKAANHRAEELND